MLLLQIDLDAAAAAVAISFATTVFHQRHHAAIIQSRRLTLFGHIMCMDDNTNAKRTGEHNQVVPASRGSAPSNRIGNNTTLCSLKQQNSLSVTTRTANSIGTFRSRLKTDLFAKAYAA